MVGRTDCQVTRFRSCSDPTRRSQPRASFDSMMRKLKRHFAGDKDVDLSEREFRGRRQYDKETVRELQQWFVVNGRRAYPDIKDTKTLDRMLRR